MCVVLEGEMEETTLTTFPAKSVTIGDKIFDSNGVVEITKSFIQFNVSSPAESLSSIRVKIYGNQIETVCFNYWGGRGNILLLINENVAETAFRPLQVTRAKVHPQFLAYWSISTHKRILFGVETISQDVRDAIVQLNGNIQISFDCAELGAAWRNENGETGPATSNEAVQSMEITTASEENENIAEETDAPLQIAATNEPFVAEPVERRQSTTLMDVLVPTAASHTIDLDLEPTSTSSQIVLNRSHGSIADTTSDQMENSDLPKIALCAANLSCLSPREYLNDAVVMAYLSHILAEKQRQAPHSPKFQLLDNFLLETVSRDIDMMQSYQIATSKFGFNKRLSIEMIQKKERNIKKAKIFDADFLILPICHEQHWFSIVVAHLSRINEEGCKVIILDSITNPEVYYEEHLNKLLHLIVASYMLVEKREDDDVIRFAEYLLRSIDIVSVPRQTNTTDCGLYLFEYLENFCNFPDIYQNWSALIDKKKMRSKRSAVKKILQSLLE